jgi:hypothetical protein
MENNNNLYSNYYKPSLKITINKNIFEKKLNNKIVSPLPNSIKEESIFDLFKKYLRINDLLTKYYPNVKKNNLNSTSRNTLLKKYKLDPFFDQRDKEKYKMDKLLEWYLTINPNFENMNRLNPSIVEYECLISGIIKDVYLSLLSKELNKIIEILNYIEDCIRNNYRYLSVIDIIEKYINLFKESKKKILMKNTYENSCVIIFPSFHQLNLYKRIFNMTAPVFNFLLINHKQRSHAINMNSQKHYEHNKIHFTLLIPPSILTSVSKSIYFNFISELLKHLQNYFVYNINIANTNNQDKFITAIILFCIFHERNFFLGFKVNNNIIINIKNLFEKSFIFICISSLFNDGLNVYDNINENLLNRENLSQIKLDKNVIEIMEYYNIILNEENMSEYVKLFIKNIKFIYDRIMEFINSIDRIPKKRVKYNNNINPNNKQLVMYNYTPK